jgi:TrmH family RNA methyltransferase
MLSSPDSKTVKYVRSLHQKRDRYTEKRYIIEGLRLVSHALARGHRPAFSFCTDALAATPSGQSLLAALGDAPYWIVTPAILASMCDTVTPQGILAVIDMPKPIPREALAPDPLLILDGLGDPGNLGTILRTAHAAGLQAVALSKGCVDPYSPKAVRAGMGAQLDLHLWADQPWVELRGLVGEERCVLADPQGDVVYWQFDWSAPVALIVSSEAHGASTEARELATARVRIPLSAQAESLNVAVATGLLLYEVRRQRSLV